METVLERGNFDIAEQNIPVISRIKNTDICTFIDLFAGMGGTRIGFELACKIKNKKPYCVFTSEIKQFAIDTYKKNFHDDNISGDITQINPVTIPDFDYLLAGFPCQPFSSAGKRKGFLDSRGGLFFTVLEILKVKEPQGFLLENVEGLSVHDNGRTLATIIDSLKDLGYHTTWKVLDASHFGVPQVRKRIYIVGHLHKKISLESFQTVHKYIEDIIQHDVEPVPTKFTSLISSRFKSHELHGKSIKDKRGGDNNIHSWDLELKGTLTQEQKDLMSLILKKRRYKKWAQAKGISWMDGMPLTHEEISGFYSHPNLFEMLEDLTQKGYLTFEHPKEIVIRDGVAVREPALNVPKGYNIVAGKLSFPIGKILDPKGFAPTLVATEAGKVAVSLKAGVRKITVREGLRISGFPEDYILEEKDYNKAFDLIGNTVIPPVIKEIILRMI